MSLTEKITEGLKQAMKAKDEAALRALRAIKAAILLAKTEKGGGDELTADQEMKLLQRLAKQRRESIEVFRDKGRPELAEAEEQELKVIEGFLPKQLSEEEIRETIAAIIAETGAQGPQGIAKVMPVANARLAGQADGKKISEIAKALLSA